MGLSLRSQTHTHTHTHTHRYTHIQSVQPRDLRAPLIMFLPWVPLSSLKLRQERGCRQEQGAEERLLRQSPSACLVGSVGACVMVCVFGEGGVVWELTLVLNDMIERHPPTPLPPPATGREWQSSSEGPAATMPAICCLVDIKGRSEVK